MSIEDFIIKNTTAEAIKKGATEHEASKAENIVVIKWKKNLLDKGMSSIMAKEINAAVKRSANARKG